MLKMKNKVLASLVIALPLLLNIGISTTVSASSSSNNSYNTTYTYNYYSESLETRLDTLVSSGTISKAQATTILDMYYNDEITTKRDMKNELDALVTAGTITPSQEISILNLFINPDSNLEISASPSVPRYNNHSSDKLEKIVHPPINQ
ncbi:hypothetical protein ACJDU8_05415 [Clostridium sp. WILCCON 0269]|uniref:Uncharacterized protein n=1 Tax=Candidatus Clostridium eludens TaxID=3381663 RepID=A0ABW8SI42_9CLOT